MNKASVLDLDIWPGGDLYSANIASELKLLTVPAWAIERVIGIEVLSGNEILGIGCLNQCADYSLDTEIFERLKTQIGLIQIQRGLNQV